MKILVNLGFGWAERLLGWEKKWEVNEAFDILPYGYCLVENEKVQIDYIMLSELEKKVFFNNQLLMKVYFYLIKTPYKSSKYDAVWTHNDRETIYMGILKCIPIIRRYIPKVIGNIIWLTDEKIKKNKLKIIIKSLSKIDKIVVLSRDQIKILAEKFHLEKEKIKFVTYGLNKSVYSDILNNNKPKGIVEQGEYILMVGTDIHRDISFFKNITKRFKDERFIFATNNNQYLNDIYGENVITVKCSLSEMKWLYKNCKYVILPLKRNTHASGCTTLIEVALQRKAVVTTDISGLDDYYVNGVTVEAVKENDLEEFEKAMKKLNNRNYREKIERQAFNYIYSNEKYSSKVYAENFLQLTMDVLDIK